jgi:K(+)-stimulated pyrophosphate-energized sodium pump
VLTTLGIAMTIDAFGPIADNARGIAAMVHLPVATRAHTDSLDAFGNTTASIAKGFAIAAAGVTALALFATFTAAVDLPVVDLTNVPTIAGLFIGAMFPFLVSSLVINAVGRTAARVIEEVRRQLRDIDGLREGWPGVRPDYRACMRIATNGALREMVLPAALVLVAPVAIALIDFEALGAFLTGAMVSGFLLAILMVNSGGAWDNAKRLIETGAFGGVGSDAHRAAVIGDAVGDPFKDAAGPALNNMIKVMTIVALIASSLVAR